MSELEWLITFSDNLKDILKEKNMSQRELAEKSGLSESSISRYINGTKMPTIKSVLNMSYVLHQDLFEFIDFDEFID